MEFETEFGNKVVIDRVDGRLRLCYFTTDGNDFDVIMFASGHEAELRAMLGE